ncbi:CBS domain-containing protein [Sulfolobus acidocaldarius]|uniref:CBS domain protein n=4 Tax=Sulfolobus acidocaldarius TaxID=2285 RepID=Q4JBJ8_SULAC|nr:CBS domain-containing protein [Sulfolobus acidocaldarius]AAY79831.1 CBS domain protein [Sulfolobus acidocaldarius DSM 639]AGE70391.1 CBS domain-containing protein [Sulfolobus acidocaldarius N8]AGE72665.1 CBS domain-containing protein [Sulfolobus acidocaldarius Ron12/I]ALU29217.1 histidine kinase [Sulfolobus acidocaldarius]ALU31944.1 histidine kinase [Sulfolobus acidocaldarius]
MDESLSEQDIVKEYMRSPVISVDKKTKISEIAKIMTEKNIGSVIVTENNKPIGIITERDIVRAIGKGKNLESTAEEIMTVSLITIREDSPIAGALSLMRQFNIRHLPVINDKRELVGILSIRDVARAIDNLLEGD